MQDRPSQSTIQSNTSIVPTTRPPKRTYILLQMEIVNFLFSLISSPILYSLYNISNPDYTCQNVHPPPAARKFPFVPLLVCCSLAGFWLCLQFRSCYWRACPPCPCHQHKIICFSIWAATQHLGNVGDAGEFNEIPFHLLRYRESEYMSETQNEKNYKDHILKQASWLSTSIICTVIVIIWENENF